MHKDRPPGILDLAAHPPRHAVWVGLTTGFLLALLVRLSYIVWTADPDGSSKGRHGIAAARAEMVERQKPPKSTPPPKPAAVRYR